MRRVLFGRRRQNARRCGAAIGALLVLVAGFGAAAQSEKSTLEQIRERGHLIVGVKIDAPRFGGLNPQTDEITGFDIDLATAIGKEIIGPEAAPPSLIPVTSQNRTANLLTGRVDMLAATMTITEDRLKEIAFSDVYLRVGQAILARKGSDIEGYQDLPGREVCTVVGATPEQTIRRLVPDAHVVTFNTYPECLLALQNQRVDAVTTGYMLLKDLQETDPENTAIVGDIFTFEAWGVGVRPDDEELLAEVNKALRQIKESSLYAELYERWIEEPLPQALEDWYAMTPEEAARLFAESVPQ